jgi:hypothetical protein
MSDIGLIIICTRGQQVKVDKEDFDELNKYKWYVNSAGYAVRHSGNVPDTIIRMHRVIMNDPDGMVIDHMNHDKLDNRRSNLRVCSRKDNVRYQQVMAGHVSRFKGVSLVPPARAPKNSKKIWRARIKVDYKDINLGHFETEEDAAIAYNEAAKKYFNEFAVLNEVAV